MLWNFRELNGIKINNDNNQHIQRSNPIWNDAIREIQNRMFTLYQWWVWYGHIMQSLWKFVFSKY